MGVNVGQQDIRLEGAGPANGHGRYGSRATRTDSKFGVRPISLEKLEELLKQDKRLEEKE